MALLIYLYPALLIVFLAINTQQVKAIVLLFKHAPTDNIMIQIQQPVLTAHLVLHIVQFVWILMCVQNVIVMNLFLPMEGFNFIFYFFLDVLLIVQKDLMLIQTQLHQSFAYLAWIIVRLVQLEQPVMNVNKIISGISNH